jgi:hypothetical protein
MVKPEVNLVKDGPENVDESWNVPPRDSFPGLIGVFRPICRVV